MRLLIVAGKQLAEKLRQGLNKLLLGVDDSLLLELSDELGHVCIGTTMAIAVAIQACPVVNCGGWRSGITTYKERVLHGLRRSTLNIHQRGAGALTAAVRGLLLLQLQQLAGTVTAAGVLWLKLAGAVATADRLLPLLKLRHLTGVVTAARRLLLLLRLQQLARSVTAPRHDMRGRQVDLIRQAGHGKDASISTIRRRQPGQWQVVGGLAAPGRWWRRLWWGGVGCIGGW